MEIHQDRGYLLTQRGPGSGAFAGCVKRLAPEGRYTHAMNIELIMEELCYRRLILLDGFGILSRQAVYRVDLLQTRIAS